MLISHKYKFIFFANPKTATTTIEKVFGDINEIETIIPKLYELGKKDPLLLNRNPKHLIPADVKKMVDPKIWENYFKFVFVRNPWDWVLSQYRQNFCKPGSKKYNAGILLNKLFIQPHPEIDCRKNTNFTKRDFYLHWYFHYWVVMGGHRPCFQHQYIEDDNRIKLVDFVGRFENIDSDLKYICSMVGMPSKALISLNVSKKSLGYREYYTPETMKLVEHYYQRDIELLNYRF